MEEGGCIECLVGCIRLGRVGAMDPWSVRGVAIHSPRDSETEFSFESREARRPRLTGSSRCPMPPRFAAQQRHAGCYRQRHLYACHRMWPKCRLSVAFCPRHGRS